jgi:hypothetical protein
MSGNAHKNEKEAPVNNAKTTMTAVKRVSLLSLHQMLHIVSPACQENINNFF